VNAVASEKRVDRVSGRIYDVDCPFPCTRVSLNNSVQRQYNECEYDTRFEPPDAGGGDVFFFRSTLGSLLSHSLLPGSEPKKTARAATARPHDGLSRSEFTARPAVRGRRKVHFLEEMP
jgi:hypothetical protein